MKMRKLIFLIGIVTGISGHAQTHEATQLLLNYEKLRQLEEILDNMYKGYRILTQGYDRIKDIAEGNFNLHQLFLDGLFAVNPSIRNYRRIPLIIEYQLFLAREHQRVFRRFSSDPNFSQEELRYLELVYSNLIDQSLKNLEELTMIVTASKLRMSDDERLQAIDRIYVSMVQKVSFLKYFNNSTQMLAIQRAKAASDVRVLRELYEVE